MPLRQERWSWVFVHANLRMSCVPESLLDGEVPAYDDFLEQRRQLMAQKINTWFESL